MATNNSAVNSNRTQGLSPLMGTGLDVEAKRHIRLLLAAERDSKQIKSAARAEKMAKLKEGKQEAEIEIAGLRTQMELEYQKAVAEISGGSGENQKRLEQDAESKIDRMKQAAEKVRDDVVLMLLNRVTAFKI